MGIRKGFFRQKSSGSCEQNQTVKILPSPLNDNNNSKRTESENVAFTHDHTATTIRTLVLKGMRGREGLNR